MMKQGARHAPGIDQRGVIQAIAEHRAALLHERGGEAEIRHVARRKQDGALAAREVREFLLERRVLGLVPGDQVRGAGADAVDARSFDEGLRHARMRGEAEIVVAAEIDARKAVELDVGRVLRKTPHGAPPPPESAGIEVREHGREGDRRDGHRDQPFAAAGSGRMPSRPNSA